MNKEFAKKIKDMFHCATYGNDDIKEINRRLAKILQYIEGYADGILNNKE